jgi:hypothetical protein
MCRSRLHLTAYAFAERVGVGVSLLCTRLRKVLGSIPGLEPAILTDAFRGSPQCLQGNSGTISPYIPNHLFPNNFELQCHLHDLPIRPRKVWLLTKQNTLRGLQSASNFCV